MSFQRLVGAALGAAGMAAFARARGVKDQNTLAVSAVAGGIAGYLFLGSAETLRSTRAVRYAKPPLPDPRGISIAMKPEAQMTESERIYSAYSKYLTLEQAQGIVDAAGQIGAHPFDLANLLHHESRFYPRAQSGIKVWDERPYQSGRATGLLQFIPDTATELGTSTWDLFGMTFEEQLPYVVAYLKNKGRGRPYANAYRLFMATFYPRAMAWSAETPFPEKVQSANPGIETPADYVEKAMATAKLPAGTPLYPAALAPAAGSQSTGSAGIGFIHEREAFGGLRTPPRRIVKRRIIPV